MRRFRRYTPSYLCPEAADSQLPFWRGDISQEESVHCRYCGSWMDDYPDPGLWDVAFEKFSAVHEAAVKDPDFPGPPMGHPHVILRGDIVERKVCLHICPSCGWWIAEDRAVLPAKSWQYWAVTLASAPVLAELALDCIGVPLHLTRRYLMRKFEARASMHPRLFELTVASVFRDLGYRACATAYSKDGDIDVVLEDSSGSKIGVQVKRRRDAIEVEQIRAFLGVLTLGDYTRGVYVSASRFSRGAREAAQRSTQTVMPIDLVDADRFFDMLCLAQLAHAPSPEDCGITTSSPPKFFRNSY